MAEVKLAARRRVGDGKGPARRLRSEGKVPAILYGRGVEPVSLEVDRREFLTALHTDAGMNVLLDIQLDGETFLALTRELQRDPVRGTVLHADFVTVDRTQAIEVEVPVHIVGSSPGVKEGGVLEHPLFTVTVRCLPGDVPQEVQADITGLAIGDSMRVSELVTGGRFEILNDLDAVVASVAAPITEEQLEAMEAEAGAVPEEVPEEGVPEEAPEEGEEGAAPEGEDEETPTE